MNATGLFNLLNLRFKEYLTSMKVKDEFIQKHLDFKEKHTYRVVSNIRILASDSGLPSGDVKLAEIIALVHDIGRFQQFITYSTFDDSVSVNHAQLGVRVLTDIDFFRDTLEDHEIELIRQAVLNHNLPRLGGEHGGRIRMFSQLIRDADKLDIWKILVDRDVVFRILDNQDPETSYTVPENILNCYRKGEVVPSGAVTINDYRLLRLSWIYDMNFPATFKLIIKRNYAHQILAKIPPSEAKDEIAGIIQHYVNQKARA